MRLYVLANIAVLGVASSFSAAAAQGQSAPTAPARNMAVQIDTPAWALWREFHTEAKRWSAITQPGEVPNPTPQLMLSPSQLTELHRIGTAYLQTLADLQTQHQLEAVRVEQNGLPADLARALQESAQRRTGTPPARRNVTPPSTSHNGIVTRSTLDRYHGERAKLVEDSARRHEQALKHHRQALLDALGPSVLAELDGWIHIHIQGSLKTYKLSEAAAPASATK